MTPFTPRLEAGKRIDWLTPASIGRQFVAADKSGQLYRVAANRQQLSLAAENSIDGDLVAGLAAAGELVYAVVRSGGGHEVVAIDSGTLQITNRWPLDGGIAWGPTRVGSKVIVADSAKNVLAFDADGNQVFQMAGLGPLAGEPLSLNGDMVLASTDGRITVVGSNGQAKATQQFSEPFGSGPVLFKQRLLVAGWDGTLYLVDVPK